MEEYAVPSGLPQTQAWAQALEPPLKWAGGKRWLVPEITPMWLSYSYSHQSSRRLVEPFVGGMAVALGLQPDAALLNDANPHLINFYCWLQQGLVVNIEMANDPGLYYRHRARFNELVDTGQACTAEAAQLFYYLNRTGYNGLCRFNKRGLFNVPFGKYERINYTRDFTSYQQVLARWEFTSGDFSSVNVEPSDFVYADPPYDVEFTSYSAGGFSWADQVRLAEWLARHEGPVVASNQATERILHLYRDLGFGITLLDGPRRISCTGDRTPVKEMLATMHLHSQVHSQMPQ